MRRGTIGEERDDTRLAAISAITGGVISLEAGNQAGLSGDQMYRRLENGLLLPVHRGVYRHAAVPSSWRGALMAAVEVCGAQAVGSHRSAARIHELRDVPFWRPEVLLLDTTTRVHRGIQVHRTDTLDAVDRTVVGGVPVTSIARTLLDLGAVVPAEVVATAAQDAMIRRLVSLEDLLTVLERLGKRGRRGTRALRLAVGEGLPPAGIQSRLEHIVLGIIRSAGVPEPVLQHTIVVDGQRIRLDFFWPERGVAVEADGRRWHATKRDFERDLRRAQAIVGAGIQVLRVGWSDAHERRDQVVHAVRGLVQSAAVAS